MDWTVRGGAWTEEGGELVGVAEHEAVAAPPVPWSPSGATGCRECTIETVVSTAGGPASRVTIRGWYADDGSSVNLVMEEKKDRWTLQQRSGGRVVVTRSATASIDPGVRYRVAMSFDGSEFRVTVNDRILMQMRAVGAPSGAVRLEARKTTVRFGSIRIF